jgi:hypothetical protein
MEPRDSEHGSPETDNTAGGPAAKVEEVAVAAVAESANQQPGPQVTEAPAIEEQTKSENIGGKIVAENNREGFFDSFGKFNESVFSIDGVKKAAAWYIETSEKLANQALEFQEKATGWAKDTPLAALFEAQHSFARKFVERSANAARTLWQIHPVQ